MSKKIRIEDFLQLGQEIKDSLKKHNVVPDHNYSIISDILFHCATMIDRRTGSHLHETINGFVDENLRHFVDGYDPKLGVVKVTFNIGEAYYADLFESELSSISDFEKSLEQSLGLSSPKKTFEILAEKKKSLKKVSVVVFDGSSQPEWKDYDFTRSDTHGFEYSISGIAKFSIQKFKEQT
jgi:hypothetical protein